MSAVVFTTFNRDAMPDNLFFVSEWMRFARAVKRSSWESAARYYAERVGGAMVFKANDDLVVFTKRRDGKVSRKTYKPGTYRLEHAGVPLPA